MMCVLLLMSQHKKIFLYFIYAEFRGSTPDNTLGSGAVSPDRVETPLPLSLSELDPETLRSGLRDFLQELRDAQKERVNNLQSTKKPTD